jgi:glycosyltransferase involved in cell wall biosynthesis
MSQIANANILILSAQVPFTRGGAEVLIDKLRENLSRRGCTVDIVSLPFNAQPKSALVSQMALWRSLDLSSFAGRKVDMVIGTKFPTYLVDHPCKVTWLIHQHRQLYELYNSRFGDFDASPEDEALRRMVLKADTQSLSECRARFTISQNVSDRLRRYLDLDSEALPPPLPLGDLYRHGKPSNYVLSVGRICSIKRVDLIVKAFAQIEDGVRLKIVGLPDEPSIDNYLRSEIDKHHLWERVDFLGRVSDDDLIKLYAEAFLVYYAPYDEDYGFVTLESLASGVPVVTASDSGTVTEFVKNEHNGLVVEPNENDIAEAVNRLRADADLYDKLRVGAAENIEMLTWDGVLDSLLSVLNCADTKQVEGRTCYSKKA